MALIYKSTLKEHSDVILKGIDLNKLFQLDFKPGKIKINGKNMKVWPFILTKRANVFLAGAEFGKGRIIAASHENFSANILENNSKNEEIGILQSNILSWLSQGSLHDNYKEALVLTNLTQLLDLSPKCKIIVYDGRYLDGNTQAVENKLIAFIQNGGGFLHSITPWSYLKVHSTIIKNLPFHPVLKMIGLSYLEDIIIDSVEKQTKPQVYATSESYLQVATDENQYVSYRSKLEDHTKVILNGVNLLANPGYPGFLMAFSNDAYPQIVSKDGRILIAAAEIASGRAIAISHNGFIEGLLDGSNQNQQLKTLQENMAKWLLKETTVDRSKLLEISNDASVNQITKDTKVLLWNHNEESLSTESEHKILEFVENGGGLLHSVNPWAYYSYTNPNKIPLHEILRKSGLNYSDKQDIMYGNDNGFTVSLNEDYYNSLQKANLYQASLDEKPFLESGSLLSFAKYLPVMLKSRPDFQEQLLFLHDNNLSSFKNPTTKDPVTDNTEKSMVVLNDLLCREMVPGMDIALGAHHFPSYPDDSELIPENLKKLKLVELQMVSEARKDIYFTGFYLQAGDTLSVKILDGSANGWFIRVGAHSDVLYPDYQHELKRFCYVHVHKALDEKELRVFSPYGGLIYFESPENSSVNKLKLSISNVICAPYLDLKDIDTVKNWDTRKLAPAPWADVCGEFVSITLPRASIQNVDDLPGIMGMWDRVIRILHFLRGTDVFKYRRHWFVTDAQPVAGYMHAGYPIVTHLDIADPNDNCFILGGNWSEFWGFYHELGHNFQRDSWTFSGTTEVTCNIFSMFCIENVSGASPMNGKWVQDQMPLIKTCLQSGEYSFNKWKEDPCLAIGIYAQLCEYLGWGCMCHVLRQYEDMDNSAIPTTDQQKIDTWFLVYSKAASVNLAPLFKFWEWPISESSLAQVSDLEAYLPDDEITQSVPERVDSIKSSFPDLKRNVEKKEFPYLFEPNTSIIKVQNM